MKFVTSVWLEDLATFERDVFLTGHCTETSPFSEISPLHVFAIKGYKLFTQNYLSRLNDFNIIVIDSEMCYESIHSKYENRLDFINEYEKSCFLRWLVFEEVLSGESFIHIDSDLYLQASVSELEIGLQGLNGTFGSPCFTVDTNGKWSEIYRLFLDQFIEDRQRFNNSYNKGMHSLLKREISSDQDLISILEDNSILPSLKGSYLTKSWSVFVNPLWPYIEKPPSAISFRSGDGGDSIGAKPVLFWHMQNDFCRYLGRFALLVDIANAGNYDDLDLPRIPHPYTFVDDCPENTILTLIERSLLREYNQRPETYCPHSRQNSIVRFLHHRGLRELFTGKHWWENGVFK